MDSIKVSENKQLVILVSTIYILCIVAFWPLMTVFVWSAAIATALMPFHKQLSSIVKPSVSVTFLTIWVLLVILLVLSVSSSILYGNIDHIGTMVASVVHGFQNTGVSSFMPTFTEEQFSHMPETLVQLLLQSLLSLTSNVMQSLISIIIFFLSLSMLLYYGEQIWKTLTRTISLKLFLGIRKNGGNFLRHHLCSYHRPDFRSINFIYPCNPVFHRSGCTILVTGQKLDNTNWM